jgi:hypothetical protein
MKTRYEQMTSGGIDGYSNFIGDDTEYRDWLGVAGRSRDSRCLEESNFECILKALGGRGDNVLVARYRHWAVGWIEEIYVRPNTEQATKAQELRDLLEAYPILDEEDFSRREQEAANTLWQGCYGPAERVKYIKKHRDQFEFRGWCDLAGCVRGKYFAGYASELIG